MKKIILTVLFLVVAGVGVWYFFFNQKTDEELIYEEFLKLVDACSKRSDETAVTMAIKNSRISNAIASSCSVSIQQVMMNGTYTPMEFSGSMTRSRALFKTLKGTVEEVEVTVAEDKQSAVVEYAVRVNGQMKKGDTFEEARDLRSEMKKEDDKWKISSFEIREVLER
jgi:hypothetical protein